MTTRPKMWGFLVILALSVPAIAAPPVTTRPAPPVATRPEPPFTLPNRANPIPERIHQRTPIPFKPFVLTDAQGKPIIDPHTGKAITRDTIVHLPNGKSITYGKWFDILNALERQNNALGYSLREHKSKAQNVEIAESAVDRTKLEAQATQIHSMGRISAQSITHDSVMATAKSHHAQAKQGSAALSTPVALAVLGKAKPAVPGVNQHWDLPMGDLSTFYVDLNGGLQLKGSNSGTTMKISARADSAVLHNSLTLVSVDGEADSPLSEALRVSLTLKVLGNSWKPLDSNAVNFLEVSHSMTQPVQWSKEYPFVVAGVPMGVEFGVRGESGVQWYFGLAPLSVTGVVTPFVHTEAFAQVSYVDVDIAKAGVEGVVTLLRDDFVILGYAQLQLDAQQKPYIYQEYLAHNQMNALDGKLRLYSCVTVPNWPDVWNTHDECTYEKIWDWTGFKQSHDLFHDTKKDSL
jgi:hypothetical protein